MKQHAGHRSENMMDYTLVVGRRRDTHAAPSPAMGQSRRIWPEEAVVVRKAW